MKKSDLRKIPAKNYVILLGVILGSFWLLFYFYRWFDTYEETKLNRRILDNYMQVINYNELDDYLIENPNTILYVSVLKNKEIREFEKLVKKKYREDLIENKILYLDITELSSNERELLGNKYYLNNLSILDVPNLLVFKNGYVDAIYSVRSNNYNIDNFLRYVNQINYGVDDLYD